MPVVPLVALILWIVSIVFAIVNNEIRSALVWAVWALCAVAILGAFVH